MSIQQLIRIAIVLLVCLLIVGIGSVAVQAQDDSLSAERAAGCARYHTVQRGETLYRIALRYGTTYQALQRLNGMQDANRLYTGQRLCVQAAGSAPVEPVEVQQIVALETVRIRTGPSTSASLVGRLFAGESASVTGISPDHRWWRIRCGNDNCWVTADPNLTRPQDGSDPNPIQETGDAVVEEVTVQILESYPIQVRAVLRGYLPDGCVTIGEVRQVRESTTFRIRMTTNRRTDALCLPGAVPFEESVPLDVTGLPAGQYDVRVNDLRAPFTLDAGNGPGEELIPVEETGVQYVQAQANLRMRSGPGTQYPIVGGLADGQAAIVTGVSLDHGWWRVICPDDTVGNCFLSADSDLTRETDGF